MARQRRKIRRNTWMGRLWDRLVYPVRYHKFRTAMVLILLGSGIWVYQTKAYVDGYERAKGAIVSTSAEQGYIIGTITLEGRQHTNPAALMEALGLERGQPLLSFDVAKTQARVEALPWVKTARVERRWPDSVHIDLVERQPFAMLKTPQGLAVIDSEGVILTRNDLESFKDLIVVVGVEDMESLAPFMGVLKAEPEILARVDVVQRISGRRWDLHLKDKVIVKLPEQDMGLALRRLQSLQDNDKVLDKGVAVLDLRLADRVIVRMPGGMSGDVGLANSDEEAFPGPEKSI